MSEQKQYPQWLSGAREAQSRLVEAERLAAEEAERSRQAKREADRQKKTDDMQEVLKAFGIVYPASEMRYEDGRAIIDLPDGYELSCDGLARKPTQYDGLRAKPDSPLRWEFRLTLRKLACEQHETYDWMRRQLADTWRDFKLV